MAQPMGLGMLGGSSTLLKRKFRWTLEIDDVCGGSVPTSYVKLAARPNLSFDETEINYLHGKTYIPGKGTWENITVTYFDVASEDNQYLWYWIASVYDFTNPVTLTMNSQRGNYTGLATLNLFDGCGEIVETWKLLDAWPQAINWGELDFGSSDECNIEITLRYSLVEYLPACWPFVGCGCKDNCHNNYSDVNTFYSSRA